MAKNSDKSAGSGIYKVTEFKKFIETIESGQAAHWAAVAEAIGVDQDTITKWKKTPQAQEAIIKGIDHALQCMQQAGARDWRMWEAKLKMLGLNPANKVELEGTVNHTLTAAMEQLTPEELRRLANGND